MIMLYHIALFAHITGVVIYLVGVGVEVIVLRGLWRAQTVEQARGWLQTGRGTHTLFRLSTLLILVAGLYQRIGLRAPGVSHGGESPVRPSAQRKYPPLDHLAL
jgi:hypothetical protein